MDSSGENGVRQAKAETPFGKQAVVEGVGVRLS